MKRTGREFIRFVIIGGINTLNYYILYLLLHKAAAFGYMISHIAAFSLSLIVSFFLNSYITFNVKPTLAKFLAFPFTQLFNFTVSSCFMYVFIEYFHLSSFMTPLLSVVAAVPMTFFFTGKILKKESVKG